MPQISSGAPSMDHLDALEARSVYILREAFARLKKLALLWSLGKDANVMIGRALDHRAGNLKGFTGIGNDYQPPERCELRLDTSTLSVREATGEIERILARSGILFDELVDIAANI